MWKDKSKLHLTFENCHCLDPGQMHSESMCRSRRHIVSFYLNHDEENVNLAH